MKNKIVVEFADGEKVEYEVEQFVLLVGTENNNIDCVSHSSDKFILDCMLVMPKVLADGAEPSE